MEKFTWYCFNKNDELIYQRIAEQTPNLKVIEENSNKYLLFDDGKAKKRFEVEIITLNLEKAENIEQFHDQLFELLKVAHADAVEKFSEKSSSKEVYPGTESSKINSCLCKWSYDVENISILTCAAEFMYLYANGHVYENANKRTALLFTFLFLKNFNIYSEFNAEEYDASEWREKLIEIVEKKASRRTRRKDHKWISKMNWRKSFTNL